MKRSRHSVSGSNCKRKGESGFTILEVLIAVSILSVGMLAVATMQVSAIRGNHFSDNTTLALALAEQKMEELMGMSYTDGDLTNGQHQENNVDDTGTPDAGGYYKRIWNVTDHTATATGYPTMKTVEVIVTWQNDLHQVSISSVKVQSNV